MRKFVFLISFLLLALAFISVTGWITNTSSVIDDDTNNEVRRSSDSTAKNYFPLKLGNSWTYKSLNSNGDTSFIRSTVLSDTLIRNVTYYRLSHELPFFEGTLITLDTVTGNIYSYSDVKGCTSFRTGSLLDSLASNPGDRVFPCGESRLFGKCIDSSRIQIFGTQKKSKFFLSPVFTASGLFNRFTEGIGITFSTKITGSGISLAYLTGCVLGNQVYGDTSTTTHVFGTVFYSDNNQPVSNGYVKALQLDRSTGNIIVLDSVQIQPGGYYYFRVLPNDSYYIVAYPNSEEECDYVPTYFPSTINWQNAVRVNTGNNPENVKISVYRKSSANGSFSISGRVSSQVNQMFSVLKDANVYLKQGEVFKSFNITHTSGEYKLKDLNSGNFQIIVNRLGYVNLKQNIILNNSNLQNINFFLEPTFIKIATTTDIVPKNFKLDQNFPNPFNPVTKIRFDIPKSSFVSLKIYNSSGKEEATLFNDMKNAGSYEVSFNAQNFCSGVYFYRLESEGYIETKKMMVVK